MPKVKEESDYEDGDQLDESCDEFESPEGGSTNGAKRRTRGKGTDKADGYQLKNVLKLPRATTYATQAIYGERGQLVPGLTMGFMWHFRPSTCWRHRPLP